MQSSMTVIPDEVRLEDIGTNQIAHGLLGNTATEIKLDLKSNRRNRNQI